MVLKLRNHRGSCLCLWSRQGAPHGPRAPTCLFALFLAACTAHAARLQPEIDPHASLHAARAAGDAPAVAVTAAAACSTAPDASGHIPLAGAGADGAAMYYAYFEATNSSLPTEERPVLLWMQGGPGCASTFGMLFEVGPCLLSDDLQLRPNPGAWSKLFGLLFIDQPIGTGFSPAGNRTLPADLATSTLHVYTALVGVFDAHPQLQRRPLFITGESYGGKYIPSLAHLIITLSGQQTHRSGRKHALTMQGRWVTHSLELPPPNFCLSGIVINNGLTDPLLQLSTLPDVAFSLGLVPPATRQLLQSHQEVVQQLAAEGQWAEAHAHRTLVLELLANASGIATPFDVRRFEGYDAAAAVDRFLSVPEVQAALGAHAVNYTSCSQAVEDAMAADIMRSATHLVADLLLSHLPVLLYQGQFDVQDGPASNEAWVSTLRWEAPDGSLFDDQPPALLHTEGLPIGWRRTVWPLTHAVLRNAGHMVPADQGEAARALLELWVGEVLLQPSKHGLRRRGGRR